MPDFTTFDGESIFLEPPVDTLNSTHVISFRVEKVIESSYFTEIIWKIQIIESDFTYEVEEVFLDMEVY
jgi:hypothetical protein